MRRCAYLLPAVVSLCSTALGAPPISQALSPEREQAWLRHVLPLPQEIRFTRRVDVHPSRVSIQTIGLRGAGLTGVAELRSLLRTGPNEPVRQPMDEAFEIVVGLIEPQGSLGGVVVRHAKRLTSLPNNAQAYIIEPRDDHGLVLAATDERGVYYACRTMAQLIASHRSPGRVRIPIVEVVDWPDLEERGVWNFPETREWIKWMTSLKLNYGNHNPRIQRIERGKPNRATIKTDLLAFAGKRAFAHVPQIVHLNFLESYGLFRAYPDMAGKGDQALAGRYFAHKTGPQHRVPNPNDPRLVDILAEWLEDIAAQGARDVCCWLSERPAEDQRPETTAVGQFVLEARAFVKAWKRARRKYPDLQIRMFLSTTTQQRDYVIYNELPPEVKIVRCCVTDMERVRHLPRDLFRNPLLDHFAAQGRWVGTYDVPLNVNGNVETPEFKTPHRSAHRIRNYVSQLVQRRYRGAAGMMAWANHARTICDFNISALSEWGWNMDGRTEKEFALAWATINGMEAPEKMAQWAEWMGPIEFDVYDSEYPISYSWGIFIDMIKARRRPVLGKGVFRYYRTPTSFDEKLVVCGRALELATTFRNPDFAHETRVVTSYIKLAKALYRVTEHVSTVDLSTLESQGTLREHVDALNTAGRENAAAIRLWRSALGPKRWHHRVDDAILGTETTVREISQFITHRYLY